MLDTVPPVEIHRYWPGETVFLLGGGPSLTGFDVEQLRGRGRVIAINNAFKLCQWADLLYFADKQWWSWHSEELDAFRGRIITGAQLVGVQGVKRIRIQPGLGLSRKREEVHGNNGGYHAINLAVHLGASTIVLLGYDMKLQESRTHWHAGHPDGVSIARAEEMLRTRIMPPFRSLVEPLRAAGVRLWPRMSLAEALTALEALPQSQCA